MYIVGIEPKAPGLHIFSNSRLARLGLPLLVTIAEKMGYHGLIFCEDIAPIQWEEARKADLVLISTITSTAPRAYDLIKRIKEVNQNDAPILIGGPHVTFLPEEALQAGADFVFCHEADESFPKFLKWFASSERKSEELFGIPGLSFKIGNHYHHNPAPPLVDLNTLPTPNLDLIAGYDKPSIIPIITSRGCPFDCEFCSETAMFGRQYRFRSEQKVLEDIQYYDKRYGKTPIFIADDNLGANPLRLERLCQAIIDHGLARPISGQVRLDLAKRPETLAIMKSAGFERAYIGYESTNPASLEAMGKRLKSEDMEGYTKLFHKNGIAIHAMWVIGFDNDTLETVKKNVRACIKWLIETTQFLILVPIPGASLYERLQRENRIFNNDWSKYDGHHVTFHPEKMTARELQIAVMLQAMPNVYNYWQTIKIFVANNWRMGTGFLTRRHWHPSRELRSNFTTLLARLWGWMATRKMKKPIKDYIKQIPFFSPKAR